MVGRGNLGTRGQHVGQTHPPTIHPHPSIPIPPPGMALPSAGSASKEKQGSSSGIAASFGKAGNGFGSGYGCMGWEFGLGIKLVCHQILQFSRVVP